MPKIHEDNSYEYISPEQLEGGERFPGNSVNTDIVESNVILAELGSLDSSGKDGYRQVLDFLDTYNYLYDPEFLITALQEYPELQTGAFLNALERRILGSESEVYVGDYEILGEIFLALLEFVHTDNRDFQLHLIKKVLKYNDIEPEELYKVSKTLRHPNK